MGNEFELNITVQDERTVRLVREHRGQVTGELVLDDLSKDLITLFQKWLRKGLLDERRDFRLLGSILYKVLFVDAVEAQFEQALTELRANPDNRMRLRLTFQRNAAALASWPWEYLYYPDTETQDGFFLATETQLVLARYMPLSSGQPDNLQPKEREPLRILVIVSRPSDLKEVEYEQVIDAIKKLEERYEIDAIETKVFMEPTLEKFRDYIEEIKPHVLHFIGHGRYNRAEQRGEIALLAEGGIAAWKTDNDFADIVRELATKPRLIVLQACEGAMSDFVANFAGLAPKLMRAETPAVVAMQYPITNKAAIAFSRGFYDSLAKGRPVDEAVQEGRAAIKDEEMLVSSAYSSRSFGTPVLHMNSESGIILMRPPVPEGSKGGKSTAAREGGQELSFTGQVSNQETANRPVARGPQVARLKPLNRRRYRSDAG